MEKGNDFFSGVLQIALGISLGGIILFALGRMYARYELEQALEAVKSVQPQAPPHSQPQTMQLPTTTIAPDAFIQRCIELGISVDQCDRARVSKAP